MVSPLNHRLKPQITRIFILATCYLLLANLSDAQSEDDVRVAILQDAPSLYIRVKGKFEICDPLTKRIVYKGKGLRKQLVKGYPNKINFSNINTNLSRIQISPLKGSSIYVNNRAFRGRINIIRKSNKRILVVNELGMEDYIRGILPHEVASWWPMDALKAQAVVARTYALHQKQFTKSKDFDFTNDVYSQVYGGKSSERWRTNRAVDLTKGEVLTFEGSLFPAYYHATCGGHTEDASILWNIDIAPLKGVICNFCADSPHFKWRANVSLKEISAKLSALGYKIGDIGDIVILSRDTSGRVSQLQVKGKDETSKLNTQINISAKDFRQALGPNLIRSTNFTLNIALTQVHFEGLGWGHGVGLCQWGMYSMAEKGYNYKGILEFYFPQSKLVNFYEAF